MIKVGRLYRERMVKSIKEGVSQKASTFLICYKGVSAAQMNTLRKSLRKKSARMCVSKSSIVGLALKQLTYEDLSNRTKGQVALIWSDSDAAEISKILVKFAKDCEGFVIQGGVLNGSSLNGGEVNRLSDLPSREVLLTQLLGMMQSPLTRFAGALNSKTRDMMSILKQLSEKKGGS